MKLEVTKLDHFGRGISYYNNKIIFIDKALPGEIVDVNITSEHKKYYEGEIVSIINDNTNRVSSFCRFYKECGACQLLHVNDEYEKEFKINKAKELLGRCDNYYDTNLNYRDKVTLHVIDNEIGLYMGKTNKLIPIDYCYLLNDKINDVIKNIRSILKDQPKQDIKTIIIKCFDNKTMVVINGKTNIFNDLDCDNLIIDNQVIKGEEYLYFKLLDYDIKLHYNSFFQVNMNGLLLIKDILDRNIEGKNYQEALDLYGGIGIWSILINKAIKNITSIEVNSDASRDAKWIMDKNKINNVKVINGKVEDYIDSFNNIDLIITDPPRSGLDSKSIEYINSLKAKLLIYISCDMMSLRRDLNLLKEYELKEVNLVNMFKKTYHCESICLLERK